MAGAIAGLEPDLHQGYDLIGMDPRGTGLDRFAARFGARPAEWHSEMPANRRPAVWRGVASGSVKVVVDRMSVPYLAGATIDFVDTIEKQGFTIDNPNAGGSCACGESFH